MVSTGTGLDWTTDVCFIFGFLSQRSDHFSEHIYIWRCDWRYVVTNYRIHHIGRTSWLCSSRVTWQVSPACALFWLWPKNHNWNCPKQTLIPQSGRKLENELTEKKMTLKGSINFKHGFPTWKSFTSPKGNWKYIYSFPLIVKFKVYHAFSQCPEPLLALHNVPCLSLVYIWV